MRYAVNLVCARFAESAMATRHKYQTQFTWLDEAHLTQLCMVVRLCGWCMAGCAVLEVQLLQHHRLSHRLNLTDCRLHIARCYWIRV